MLRTSRILAVAALLTAAACSDSAAPDLLDDNLSVAFDGVPIGFDNTTNTFGDSLGTRGDWLPGDEADLARIRPRPDARRPGDGMLCGGLGGPFGGGFDFGFNLRFFMNLPSTCVFNPATERIECDTVDRHGLDVVRSLQFKEADGTVQRAFDTATTDYANVRVNVTGTTHRRRFAVTTVRHASDRTVTGLTFERRRINGTSAGSEHTVGVTPDSVAFEVERIIGDTVDNVLMPKGNPREVYPLDGTVIRSMQVTFTRRGREPVINTWREVITYDGSAIATVVITRNGRTKTCKMALPHGRLICA